MVIYIFFCFPNVLLVLVDHVLLANKFPRISRFKLFEVLFEPDHFVGDLFVHLVGACFDVLVHVSQAQARFINAHVTAFVERDTVVQSRLVHEREDHVSDLLHREHSRLLEPLCF